MREVSGKPKTVLFCFVLCSDKRDVFIHLKKTFLTIKIPGLFSKPTVLCFYYYFYFTQQYQIYLVHT